MEGKMQFGSSSSSFTSELFGSNQSHPSSSSSSSSSSGIFASIFPPSSKVLGRESLRSQVSGKTASEGWNSKTGTPDDIYKGNDGETPNTANKDVNSIYQEQRVQPCHLSSSIYYGGQDVYSHPPSTTQSAGLNSLCKKDGAEDDSGSASRGNWWQGSLYY